MLSVPVVLSFTSQAQLEPWMPARAVLICLRRVSKEPKSSEIAFCGLECKHDNGDGKWKQKECIAVPTDLQSTIGLAAAVAAGGGQVLPEEGVVEVATAVEVEERGGSSGVDRVAGSDGVQSATEACDVCRVVFLWCS